MRVIIKENRELASQAAFALMKSLWKPQAYVLGLATGSTPLLLYREMIKEHQENGFSYQNFVTVNLDEYLGIPVDHSQSYHTFMKENLFQHVDFKESFLPSGEDVTSYQQVLQQHPIDLQILGLGANGHIGFNEPGSSFEESVHLVDLTEQTIADNARFFDGDEQQVPRRAITMGIADIMKSQHIIIMAFGKEKSAAVKAMLHGEVSPQCPASILQTHLNVTVFLDEDAASLL